jgi:hypothetical protein
MAQNATTLAVVPTSMPNVRVAIKWWNSIWHFHLMCWRKQHANAGSCRWDNGSKLTAGAQNVKKSKESVCSNEGSFLQDTESEKEERMQKRLRRPDSLKGLIFLQGVNSIFLLLWGVLLPIFPFHVSQMLVAGTLQARFLVASVLSIFGFVVAGGLWMRLPSAFRIGFMLAAFTLALAIFWTIVSFSIASIDLGIFLVLILNSTIIFFFLHPPVARAMLSREKR